MSQFTIQKQGQIRHSDEMQDIISVPPPWLLTWGMSLFLGLIIIGVFLSAIIKFPDIVQARLKITSSNFPKAIVAKTSGKISKLLVTSNQSVNNGQPLAYIESSAQPEDVLFIMSRLYVIQKQLIDGKEINSELISNNTLSLHLGELQTSYETFIQGFLSYQAAVKNGLLKKQEAILKRNLTNIDSQKTQLKNQKELQQQSLKLAKDEYHMHEILADQKVETQAELRTAKATLLTQEAPIIQTENSIISATSNANTIQKDIVQLRSQMRDELTKFSESLNSLISQGQDWESKYVLFASQKGKVSFAGNIQINQVLQTGQEVFYINPGNDSFFGEMPIPQENMGKVREHQVVLIKLHSYPYEEFGIIKGKIQEINDVPFKDSVFFSKVDFSIKNNDDIKKPIHLKQGMLADAEIITEDATLLDRVFRSLIKTFRTM